MRDPSERDICPRFGSPLWLYMASVTTVGLTVLALALLRLSVTELAHLLAQPLFWAVAGLTLLAEARPIVAPGKSHPSYGTAALTFSFAALLYWSFPVAALLRAAFNMAQVTLSLGAAGLVLSAAGTHRPPLAPWLPEGGQLLAVALAGLAYFVVNFVLVDVAVALHSRTPIGAALRAALPHQASV